jgi:sulfite exporter TauE/SafE
MRHSTDPDHVVAVSTIVSKQRSIRQAGLIGSIWGLGHTLTIFAVGSMIILFGVVIPPRLGLSMEFSVALMLILLGVLNLTGVMQRLTSYLTRNGKPLSKAETLLDRSVGRFGVYQCVRPLVIGIVHGLAGSAAVALLVLSTIHSPAWATVYLLIFGAGTMVGMMCMTAVMAVPLAMRASRFGSSAASSVSPPVWSVFASDSFSSTSWAFWEALHQPSAVDAALQCPKSRRPFPGRRDLPRICSLHAPNDELHPQSAADLRT